MNATDIQRKYLSRERTRCEVYQHIADRCFRRLHWSVEQGHTKLIFKIPPWLFGLPRYSVNDAEIYLIEAIRHKGFHVQSYGDGLLEIDWSQYLPNAKEVRDTVRHEHIEKMRTPRNRLSICDANWLNDGPLHPSGSGGRGRGRGALPPTRPVLTDAQPFMRQTANTPGQSIRQVITSAPPSKPNTIIKQWMNPAPQFQQTQINSNMWAPPPTLHQPPPRRGPSSVISHANSKTSMSIKW
jgi:hypothetical protein